MMSIESDWHEIEAVLEQHSPRVLSDLRPPITPEDVTRWSATVGELPEPLIALYGVHAGTTTRGAGGFSFIAEWYPLTVDDALVRYEWCQKQFEIWGHPNLIPFAFDLSAYHLAVTPGGGSDLSVIRTDSPPGPYDEYPNIETLLSATVNGLRGNSPDWRPEFTENELAWINLEEEADDLGF
jgi:hypothetical protein